MESTADFWADETPEQLDARIGGRRDMRLSSVSQLRVVDHREYRLGLGIIDELAGPMLPGDFVVVGAREGQGKSAVIEKFMLVNADERKIVLANLDMDDFETQDRVLARLMGIRQVEVQWFREQNSQSYQDAMDLLRKRDVIIHTPQRKGDSTMRALHELCEDVSAEIVVVDYCSLIEGWEPGNVAGEIVNEWKRWGKRKRITTVMLTQLRDDAVNRRPHNGHISDTKKLAERADRVVMVYRPYAGIPRKDTVSEIIHTKNKRGPMFRGHVGFIASTMDYYQLTDEEESRLTCCRDKS